MSGPVYPSHAKLCRIRRDGAVVRLSGEIDMGNAAMLTDRILAEIRAGAVRLDLSEVTFLGADGVRLLLAGRDAAQAEGRSLSVACSPWVLRVLRVCGLADVRGLVVTVADGSDPGSGWTGDGL